MTISPNCHVESIFLTRIVITDFTQSNVIILLNVLNVFDYLFWFHQFDARITYARN